ncbi:MAG TPA: SDR family oxidoreductase [Gemmataceae bacterium]|jgi:nucleoside-diphosphate-sugar epimerase|nr:SDR family oxidoreductase [Gemmataceae bacterium]
MATHLILGCGYLGRVVAGHWLASGHPVAALTRSRTADLQALGVEPILGDVTDPASLRLPPADTVLYAVGLDRSAGKGMREVYVGGLTSVIDALPAPRRFIHVSSTSVYGQTDGGWVDESSPTEPTEESGRIVLECEQLLLSRLPHATVLRFAGIYGPGRVIRRAAVEKGEPLAADPDGWLNLIHVEDGASAVVAAADRAVEGQTINVADDRPVSRREFYTTMAELLGAPPAAFTPGSGGGSNRRVGNRRMRESLGVALTYPDFRGGLRQAIG